MPAIMEQTTVDQCETPEPTAIFDREGRLITAEVIVSWDSIEDKLIVQAPIIDIPGPGTEDEPSPWTVLWKLMPDCSTIQLATFNSSSQGVIIPGPTSVLPLGVSLLESEPGETPDQWRVLIENKARSLSSFNYDLAITGTLISADIKHHRDHDPTIVVTPDPIGG
ncbi:MAG TPA: hypothetical protein VH394_12680 [Thermoanaerobaculia bacterium]|nr:hypothetical protein [Thermoanaerobaculia bacterium]